MGNRVGEMQGAEYGNWFNRLMSIAQGGQQAAGNVTGATSQYTGQAMGATQAQGDARASGVLGVGNSITGAIGAGTNAYLLNNYLNPRQPPGPTPQPINSGQAANAFAQIPTFNPVYRT